MEWFPFQPSPGLWPIPIYDYGNQIRIFNSAIRNPQFMDIISPCLNIFSMIKIIIGLRKINKGNDG